jgi:hypothetical protein
LRVGDGQGAERLLPFVAAVVLEVELAQARVRVDWETGLGDFARRRAVARTPFVVDVAELVSRNVCRADAFGGDPTGAGRRALELHLWNPRDFTVDRHRTVDDRPYGGGPGMVMMAEPLAAAITAAKARQQAAGAAASRVICLSPQGSLADAPAGDASGTGQGSAGAGLRALRRDRRAADRRVASTKRFRSAISCFRVAKSRRWR